MKHFLLVLLNVALGHSGNQCFDPDQHFIQNGYKRNSESFSIKRALGPMDCARKCKLHSLCRVANLNKRNDDCSLLDKMGDIVPDIDSMIINAWDMNDNILGHCKGHQCPRNTVCTEDKSVHHCKPIGCSGNLNLQNINISSFTSKTLWQFGEIVEYACKRGYFTQTNASCTEDGSWSDFTCTRFNGCNDLNKCQEKEFKDYWLYVNKLKSTQKIFCHYGSFVSLTEYNMASTPAFTRNSTSCDKIPDPAPEEKEMGYTDFQKYKYQLFTSRLLNTTVHLLNSTYVQQGYGRAGDCYAGNDSSVCGVLGHFIINLKGTGFKVNSSVQWKTWGTDGVIHNITRSDNDQVVEGFCGGNCGGCEADGYIFLEAYPQGIPAFETAELPICKFPL